MHSEIKVENFFGLGEEHSHLQESVFQADHPEVFAATDNGITPIEYLLVGLASCLSAGVASVAENRGIQLRSVESIVEGDARHPRHPRRRQRRPQRLQRHQGDVHDRRGRVPEDIEALVAQSQKRSAVFDALTNPTNVTVEVA